MIEFLFGLLTVVANLLLEQGDELVGLAPRLFQAAECESAPPLSDLASYFHPCAFD